MCGRYTLTTLADEVAAFFQLPAGVTLFEPRYNIAPTQPILAVRAEFCGKAEMPSLTRVPAYFSWGLVPSWSKHPNDGAKLINARAETIAEKVSFRSAFQKRRCLIPTTGFYEWKSSAGKKRPLHFTLKNEALFALAGVFEEWHGPNGELLESCAIITTMANELVQPLHDRMPAIMNPCDFDMWLDPRITETNVLSRLLAPFPPEKMMAEPVGNFVNSAKNEGAQCLEPFQEEPSLFE